MLKSEKGVSAVEFALIAPLLFVLTFAIIEFGLLLFDKAVITNASREGARAAIVFNTDEEGEYLPATREYICEVVTDYANGYLVNLGSLKNTLSCADIDIEYSDPDGGSEAISEGDVRVTANFTYDFLVFPNLNRLIGGGFDGTVPLRGTTTMRME